MARGTSLLRLTQMVREETGRSSSVGVGVDDLPGLKTKISRAQETLYDDNDWPHLYQKFDRETLSAGERYYDVTPGLNFDRIQEVVVWWSGLSHPIERGILFSDYNIFDSALGIRSEPVVKWDVVWTGTKEQVEIWPLPSSNTQQIQFSGIRNLRPLVADADVADLDDRLIALTVAVELLAGKDDKSVAVLAGQATKRLNTLLGNARNNMKRYRVGMGDTSSQTRRAVTIRVR